LYVGKWNSCKREVGIYIWWIEWTYEEDKLRGVTYVKFNLVW
jgi:hypothetical protein